MAAEWFVRIGDVAKGPISSEMLKQLAQKGKLTPTMLIRKGDSGNWIPASRVKGLFPQAVPETPQPVAEVTPPAVETTPEPVEPEAVAPAPQPQFSRKPAQTSPEADSGWLANGLVRFLLIVVGFIACVVVFFGIIIIGSLHTTPSDTLIGKWQMPDKPNRFEFFSDGNVMVTNAGGQIFLKWKRVDDNHIRIGMKANDGEAYEVTVDDTNLNIKSATGTPDQYRHVTRWEKER
jgi:hypothetical protein